VGVGELLLFLGVSFWRLCSSWDMNLLRSSFRWAYGLYSVLPNTCYALVGIRISQWGSLAPSAGLLCPGYFYPFVFAVEAMTLYCWLLDPFPDPSEWGLLLGYGWVVYGSWVLVFLFGWA